MTVYPSVFILRHGQTEWNVQHRFQGRLDSPLTALGEAQAQAQHRILAAQDLTDHKAFSSPQGRAFHTASIALRCLVPAIQTDSRLREIGIGEWEGCLRRDLPGTGVVDDTEESALTLYEQAPEGEGFAALRDRCSDFLSSLRTPAVIVTHGITSRMLRLVITGRDDCDLGVISGGQGVVFHLKDGAQKKVTIGA